MCDLVLLGFFIYLGLVRIRLFWWGRGGGWFSFTLRFFYFVFGIGTSRVSLFRGSGRDLRG